MVCNYGHLSRDFAMEDSLEAPDAIRGEDWSLYSHEFGHIVSPRVISS
jgi:hypothetical protein